jgi:hypothetical protein
MKRVHRRWHRVLWAGMPVALAASFVLAWAYRPDAALNAVWPGVLTGGAPPGARRAVQPSNAVLESPPAWPGARDRPEAKAPNAERG